MTMMMITIIMMMMMMMILLLLLQLLLLLLLLALKGANRDFLQSHCAASCLQHANMAGEQ